MTAQPEPCGERNNAEPQRHRDATKAFALRILQYQGRLPRSDAARILGRQLLRASTSVAANYRAACRAKSPADFISKLGTVVEEADETLFWLELIEEAGIISSPSLTACRTEAEELLRLFSASLATAKKNSLLP